MCMYTHLYIFTSIFLPFSSCCPLETQFDLRPHICMNTHKHPNIHTYATFTSIYIQ